MFGTEKCPLYLGCPIWRGAHFSGFPCTCTCIFKKNAVLDIKTLSLAFTYIQLVFGNVIFSSTGRKLGIKVYSKIALFLEDTPYG